jgi:hypothetical protein
VGGCGCRCVERMWGREWRRTRTSKSPLFLSAAKVESYTTVFAWPTKFGLGCLVWLADWLDVGLGRRPFYDLISVELNNYLPTTYLLNSIFAIPINTFVVGGR